MKRALVLGGGGPVGLAWELGVLSGLLDGRTDVSDADVIVGTSAGAVIGTHLRHGRDPRDILREMRDRSIGERPPGVGPQVPQQPDRDAAMKAFGIWGSGQDMTQERCALVGEAAMAAKTMPESQWLESFRANAWPGWPADPLILVAVECESGAFRTFDRESGVPIEVAVAASCSVPAIFPPVAIDGRHYTDGGVRSGTSADLALPFAPERVLILAPMGTSGQGTGIITARQAAEEKAQLEAAGATVRLVHFGEAAQAAGKNLMDMSMAGATADAGYAQGQQLAAEAADWW